MLYNYLKIAWRQLFHDKIVSVINISGLAFAVGIAILIGLFIQNELQMDRWEHSSPIYRIYRYWEPGSEWVYTPSELASALRSEVPEVLSATNYRETDEYLLSVGSKQIFAENGIMVDSSFFTTLELPFKFGTIENAMIPPNAAVLSAEMAKILFGDEDPVGQTIEYNGTNPLVITGVVEDDLKSHLIKDIYIKQPISGYGWLSNAFATYVKVKAGSQLPELANKIDQVTRPHLKLAFESYGYQFEEKNLSKWGLQPIEDIHLYSQSFIWSDPPLGNIRYLYVLGLVGGILLIVAIFNYVNLTTGRATLRAKEIGVRKMTGAIKSQLITQFLTETWLQTSIAVLLGIGLAVTGLPLFQNLTNSVLTLNAFAQWPVILGLILSVILLGGLAGIYPAFFLSQYSPQQVMNRWTNSNANLSLRHILIVLQFTVVVVMLVVLGFMSGQIRYMMNQSLGFDAEQVLVIPHNEWNTQFEVNRLKEQFLGIDRIDAIGISSEVPGQPLSDWTLLYQSNGTVQTISTDILYTNASILETWGLELVEGRFFNAERPADSTDFVVNEAFINQFQMEDPLNTPIRLFADSIYRSIIGVVKDFHFMSLDQPVEPIAMTGGHYKRQTSLRVNTNQLPETLQKIEQLWSKIEPEYPIRYEFLDQSFAQQYAFQQRIQKGLSLATILTIFIAFLGLFGLATFAIQRKRKEIGIRKVLGASVSQIVRNLNWKFLKLIGIALLIGLPLSYWITQLWLQNFAFPIPMYWWIFALVALSAIGLALLTISYHSIQAALANPVDALRNE